MLNYFLIDYENIRCQEIQGYQEVKSDMGLSSEERQKGIYFANTLEQIKNILNR